MFNIGNYFDKVKNIAFKEFSIRDKILSIIKTHTGVVLEMKDIEIINKIVRVKASPSAKSHIFIKKQAILEDIRKSLPSMIVTDLQ